MGECFMQRKSQGLAPRFDYTGRYITIDEGQGNWRIKFLSSGTLSFRSLLRSNVDVFLVGGGGKAAQHPYDNARGHGGGGYTRTEKNIALEQGTEYEIVVGGSAEDTSAFGYVAAHGNNASIKTGTSTSGSYYWDAYGGDGGSGGAAYNGTGGSDGGNATGTRYGKGQITKPGPNGETGSTREFGDPDGVIYSYGGMTDLAHDENTGNGGWYRNADRWNPESTGCSGIVIIRNAREVV